MVKDAVKVKIYNIDKEEFTAKIIGTDPKTDLALLKINVKNVPYHRTWAIPAPRKWASGCWPSATPSART